MYYITETDHLEDPELQIYTKLSETQLYHCREPHKGLFIAESPKVIERALNAGYKPVSMLMDRQQMKGEGAEILERIGTLEGDPLPVYMAEETVLRNLTGFPLTRGCLCAMERKWSGKSFRLWRKQSGEPQGSVLWRKWSIPPM